MSPPWFLKKVILLSIDGTCSRVISSNDSKGFISYLPILPFNTNIESQTLVFGVTWLERTLMSNDLTKLPNNVIILHILLDKVHELIISDNLLILIFIDRASKFNVFLIGVVTYIMLIDVFNNTGSQKC